MYNDCGSGSQPVSQGETDVDVIFPDRSGDTSNPFTARRTKELVAVTESGHVTSIVTGPTARASAAIVMHGQ